MCVCFGCDCDIFPFFIPFADQQTCVPPLSCLCVPLQVRFAIFAPEGPRNPPQWDCSHTPAHTPCSLHVRGGETLSEQVSSSQISCESSCCYQEEAAYFFKGIEELLRRDTKQSLPLILVALCNETSS